jgi:hypothetical protein
VLTEKEYAFTHDRVQAAFALLDRHEKSHLHLTTASLLADAARRRRGMSCCSAPFTTSRPRWTASSPLRSARCSAS